MMEEWKPIKGYEKMYQISNFGRVKRLKGFGCKKDRILRPLTYNTGYQMIWLQQKQCLIHRLVAEAFIPNPNNYTEINHKDEDKTNNRVDNLEWCNHQYNIDYSQSMPINQYSKNGRFIREWKSAMEAFRQLGIWQQNIYKCCVGKLKSAGGFKWYYVDDYAQYIDQPLF